MHVLFDDASVENGNSRNYNSAGYVAFVIMSEGQESRTAELHKEQHESTPKFGTVLLDTHNLHTHCLRVYVRRPVK